MNTQPGQDECEQACLSGELAQPLLEEIARWGNTTTVILHGGCVFEFKGPFPQGKVAQGYFNFGQSGRGFEGHINLSVIKRISFQDKLHRGNQSYAFVFQDSEQQAVFKVFLGRDPRGELLPDQVAAFNQIRETLTL